MAGLIKRLQLRKKRAEQQAARQEVLAEIKVNPIGGYGLYHLLDDAGLISEEAKEALAPLIARIEQRLHLDDDKLTISLPMPYDPITDIEHDTLTSVIGQALHQFAQHLPHLNEAQRLARLLGVNNMLQRHVPHTAAIAYEVGLEQVLYPLLQHCGDKLTYYRPDRMSNAQPEDYFRITGLRSSKQKFARPFLQERNLQENEIVRIKEVWEKGYLCVQRLSHTAAYSRAWTFYQIQHAIPQDDTITAIHEDEGDLYRVRPRHDDAVAQFIDLYRRHMDDRSEDPTIYQPIGPQHPSP